MDKFADMAMFASIVKNQGLAAAGRELGLSPATVTARLQALEERYGVKLLNRSTRHLSLTDSGATYYQACLEILEAVKATEDLLQTGSKRGAWHVESRRAERHWQAVHLSDFIGLLPALSSSRALSLSQ